MPALMETLQDVFRDVFGDDELQVTEATSAADVDGWDSLLHINLIIALEKRFGVKFATAEISRLNTAGANVGTLLDVLQRKLA